jgi:Ca-activated chloride channel family protein
MSAALHAGMLVCCLMLAQVPGCVPQSRGLGDRGIEGTFFKSGPPGGGGRGTEIGEEGGSAFDSVGHAVFEPQDLPSSSLDVIPDQPPVALSLPGRLPSSQLAVGPPSGTYSAGTGSGAGNRSGSGDGGGGIGGGEGGGAGTGTGTGAGEGEGTGSTSLFGAEDQGSRFVYVIDRSWSMEGDGVGIVPMTAAKSELIASVQQLTAAQSFQVIFYNEEEVLVLRSNSANKYFQGTDSQRLDAVRQIRLIQPSGGTVHMPAIQQGLELEPDVLFFLTDGEEPPLSDRDLAEIRRANQGTHIHCIQFGNGRRTTDASGADPGNWLQKLAAQNQGTYIYRDVTQLGRP